MQLLKIKVETVLDLLMPLILQGFLPAYDELAILFYFNTTHVTSSAVPSRQALRCPGNPSGLSTARLRSQQRRGKLRLSQRPV